jgi:hypothetical protein
MDLLERYLQAVRFFLPRGQQDDIIRELSENLISEIEDRQEELGRTLNESEVADILRRHGHPMLVAGRYRSRQHLIGPVFFPIYLFTLKLGLGVALIVTVVLAVVTAALSGDPIGQAVKAMSGYPGRALVVFGWTTLVFALLDLAQARMRLSHSWDPRTLPKVIKHEYQIPRLRTLCELFLVCAYLIWLLLVPRSPFLLLGPAAFLVEFAPIWQIVYVPILLLTVATAVLYLVNFFRPYWTRTRSLMRAALAFGHMLVLGLLIRAGQYFVPASALPTVPDGVQIERMVSILNASFQIGFIIGAVATVADIVRELLKVSRRNAALPHNSAPASASRS